MSDARGVALKFVEDGPKKIWDTVEHVARELRTDEETSRVEIQFLIQDGALDLNKDMLLIKGDGAALWP